MEQAKIEQLAFLYLCSEHDKRLLLKKEKMPLADFDRLTYLIYHFGFKEYHIKVWMEFAGEFKNQKLACIKCGCRIFVKMHPKKAENGFKN